MKKFLFLLPFLLVINGCADTDFDIDTGNNIVTKDGILGLGYNKINMQPNKTLYTAVYLNNKNTINDNAFFSLESNINIPVTNKIYYKTQENKNVNKIKLEEYLRDFQKFVVTNNIQPANNKSYIYNKTIPNNIAINSKWDNVYVLDIEKDSYKQINATCIAVSNHAYFFAEDSSLGKITDIQIQEIKNSFDKDYEIIHQYFGKENDIDKNGKVIFLITDLPINIMGFFSSVDKYFNKDLHNEFKSNESDMLYVNSKYFQEELWKEEKTNVLATFIHEFQHMTFFDTRANSKLDTEKARWLNEGLSMLAEYYGGYGKAHHGYLYSFFEHNQGETLVTEDTNLDYGYSYLFTRYINERCGNNMIKSIYVSKYTGQDAVSEACNMEFNILFQDFVKMVLYTGRGITNDKRYNIEAFNYPKGSEGYEKNGFNLSEIIDTVISINRNNNEFLTTDGYSKAIYIYSFVITKWLYNDNYLKLTSRNNNIKGFYTLW